MLIKLLKYSSIEWFSQWGISSWLLYMWVIEIKWQRKHGTTSTVGKKPGFRSIANYYLVKDNDFVYSMQEVYRWEKQWTHCQQRPKCFIGITFYRFPGLWVIITLFCTLSECVCSVDDVGIWWIWSTVTI